jgi:hypothetical protein
MMVSAYKRDGWYKIVAENKFGERSEYGATPGDGIYEYLEKERRLNVTFLEYWLVKNDREEDKIFLEFLQRANDHRTPRKLRLPGWDTMIATGDEPPPKRHKGPGDVTVYGSTAEAKLMVLDPTEAPVAPPPPKRKKLFGRI